MASGRRGTDDRYQEGRTPLHPGSRHLGRPEPAEVTPMPIIPRTAVSLKSAEFVGTENRFLDGRTSDPVVQVGLAPTNLEPFTGTRWLVRPAPSATSSSVALECLGHIDGPRFLDGRTEDGTVGLA